MELLRKLRTLFKSEPEEAPVTSAYSDETFLNVVAELARKRTRDEQTARQEGSSSQSLGERPLA
jgi:hypothetical protein